MLRRRQGRSRSRGADLSKKLVAVGTEKLEKQQAAQPVQEVMK